MSVQVRVDTEKSPKQYRVVVIDCWSVLGDHAVPPEAKIVATYEADAVQRTADPRGTVLTLSNQATPAGV